MKQLIIILFSVSLCLVACNFQKTKTKENLESVVNNGNTKEAVKRRLNTRISFSEDSTSLKYSKYTKYMGEVSSEEWIEFDSTNRLEFVSLVYVDVKDIDSMINCDVRLFSTSKYDTSYVVVYDENKLLQKKELSFKGDVEFSRPNDDRFVLEVILLKFDLEGDRCISRIIHKQFQTNKNGEWVEENYSLKNKAIDDTTAIIDFNLFKEYKRKKV